MLSDDRVSDIQFIECFLFLRCKAARYCFSEVAFVIHFLASQTRSVREEYCNCLLKNLIMKYAAKIATIESSEVIMYSIDCDIKFML